MEKSGLRRPGAIVLLSCYELGHQPLGLALPAAFLARAGFRPELLDLPVQGFDDVRIRSARFVGISVPMHTALRMGVVAADRIRKLNPECHICFYGIYAVLNAEHLLSGPADSVLGGEYEEALVQLVLGIDEGREPSTGDVRRARSPKQVLSRLEFPLPSRAALPPLEHYAKLRDDEGDSLVGYVEASRGCRHLCRHCPIPPVYAGRFFALPVEVVLEDIAGLVASGARHITFGDPDFLNGPTHALRVARGLHARFPDVSFDFTAKVEHLLRHRGVMPEFARLGCRFIVSAVESLSDVVLHHLAKGHSRADVALVLSALRDAGIALRPSLVSFTPWTTLRDYVEVLDFVATEGLVEDVDPVQYAIRLLIPPGSGLLSCPALRPFLGEMEPREFSYRWTHPDPRMDLLHGRVLSLVEDAIGRGEEPYPIFRRVRKLAYALLDRRPEPEINLAPGGRIRSPRLTEPWFC